MIAHDKRLNVDAAECYVFVPVIPLNIIFYQTELSPAFLTHHLITYYLQSLLLPDT